MKIKIIIVQSMAAVVKMLQQEFINTFGESYYQDDSDGDEAIYEIDTAAFIIITRPYTADFKDALNYAKKCLRDILPQIDKQKQVYIIIATGNTKLTFSYVIYKVLQETR